MHKANIPFIGYADDFLLFTPGRHGAERALNAADKALRRLDLALHPDKTRVVRASPNVHFLGESLPYPPTPIRSPKPGKRPRDKHPG